jgi:hypothetical protein
VKFRTVLQWEDLGNVSGVVNDDMLWASPYSRVVGILSARCKTL